MGKGELENQYTKVISYPVKTTCLVKRELYLFLRETNRSKVFKNGPSKICGTQPLKNLK